MEIEKGSYLDMKIDEIIHKVKKELIRATKKCGKFNNAHEGYAVLLEEVDELWDIIKLNQHTPNRNSYMENEAIQVSAMAIRLILDCIL